MRKRPTSWFIATLALALAALPLYGQVFDDFESVTAGESVDNSTALGGVWQDFSACPCQGVTVGDGPAAVQDESITGIPAAPNGGNNYLRLSDVTGRRDAILDLNEMVRIQLVNGTPIILQYDMYFSGVFVHMFVLDDQGLGAGKGGFQYELAIDGGDYAETGAAANSMLYRSPPINRADSTLTATPNTWTHVKFEHVLGTTEATLTLGENSVFLTDTVPMNVDNTAFNEGNGNIGQFFFTISSGADMLIDNLSFSFPSPELKIDSFNVSTQDTLSFLSEAGLLYALEYALPPATSVWQATGFSVTGDGGTMFAFDPAEPGGSSTTKIYRAVHNLVGP